MHPMIPRENQSSQNSKSDLEWTKSKSTSKSIIHSKIQNQISSGKNQSPRQKVLFKRYWQHPKFKVQVKKLIGKKEDYPSTVCLLNSVAWE